MAHLLAKAVLQVRVVPVTRQHGNISTCAAAHLLYRCPAFGRNRCDMTEAADSSTRQCRAKALTVAGLWAASGYSAVNRDRCVRDIMQRAPTRPFTSVRIDCRGTACIALTATEARFRTSLNPTDLHINTFCYVTFRFYRSPLSCCRFAFSSHTYSCRNAVVPLASSPYSEHSSFRELNVGSAKSREKMKAWCDRWAGDKKKN
jgi:hypothetical protein